MKTNYYERLPTFEVKDHICVCCLSRSQHKEQFPKYSSTRATKAGTRIHPNLTEPMQETSLRGARYILVFTNDFSRKSWLYFLQDKRETFRYFQLFKSKIETITDNKLTYLRYDRGGKYLSQEFTSYCQNQGTIREFTQAYSPQQNGVLEHKNRTIMEQARSISKDCDFFYHCGLRRLQQQIILLILVTRAPTLDSNLMKSL